MLLTDADSIASKTSIPAHLQYFYSAEFAAQMALEAQDELAHDDISNDVEDER